MSSGDQGLRRVSAHSIISKLPLMQLPKVIQQLDLQGPYLMMAKLWDWNYWHTTLRYLFHLPFLLCKINVYYR